VNVLVTPRMLWSLQFVFTTQFEGNRLLLPVGPLLELPSCE
jgi:hypothetical protein